jgi:fructose 1,6-bisphosphatase
MPHRLDPEEMEDTPLPEVVMKFKTRFKKEE